jgi:cyclopropane-fatty-acyl-phospholipid synthase
MLIAADSMGVRRLEAARRLFSLLAETLDLDVSIRLWDGTRIPLGQELRSSYEIVIENAAVLSSLIRRPTRDNLLLHYANGALVIEGGDPRGFIVATGSGRGFKKLRRIPRWRALRAALGVARARPQHARQSAAFRGAGDDEQFVRFHYDIGNDFYGLFLGNEMQYSCGYFEAGNEDLDRAQAAKLDRICRSLKLVRGERFLDVGCGWGGLLCHAAKHYGVEAHGLTLSQEQFEYVQEKIRGLGLESLVSVELTDYSSFEVPARGAYDKIASIEMSEHVGLANFPDYLRKMRSLLCERGLLINQATTRRAKRTEKRSRRLRAGSRLIERYVFPGFELDNIGHTVAAMEAARLEVHQVEGWRDHYAKTTEIWCRRLWDRRKEAENLVGEEKTRLWLAYLAGVSIAFQAGSLRVYQIVAAKQGDRERSRAITADTQATQAAKT